MIDPKSDQLIQDDKLVSVGSMARWKMLAKTKAAHHARKSGASSMPLKGVVLQTDDSDILDSSTLLSDECFSDKHLRRRCDGQPDIIRIISVYFTRLYCVCILVMT